jgi:tetratricopeptide (TPR) repeat protein
MTEMTVAVDKPVVAADGESNASICAELKDKLGNPVEGQDVLFKTDLGQVHPSQEVTSNSEGNAIVTLTSEETGVASVTVQPVGISGIESAAGVIFEAGSPAKLELDVASSVATADGKGECVVDALVKDRNDNPVSGKSIAFKLSTGIVVPSGDQTTDKQGKVQIRVISRSAGTVQVTAECEEASSDAELEFHPGDPSSIAIFINPTVEEGWKKRVPSDHWAQIQEALKLLGRRKFNQAVKILKKEENTIQDTVNLPAMCALGYAYQEAGRRSEAERAYRLVVDRASAKKEVRVKARDVEEVSEVVLPRAEGGPPSPGDVVDLAPKDYLIKVTANDDHGNAIPGLALEFESSFGWVPEEFRNGLTNDSGEATSLVTTFSGPGWSALEFAWMNLGTMREGTIDYPGAMRCYRSAIKVKPDSMRALEHLASVMVKTGDGDGAKKCYYNLARGYSRKGQIPKAIEYYGKALEIDPRYAKALSGYGVSCLKLGDLERAQKYLEESRKADRSAKVTLANLALLYHLNGKFDKAIKMNKQALKLDPGFKQALVNLHEVHAARGDKKQAGEYLGRIQALGG